MKRAQWIAVGMLIGFILFWLISLIDKPIEKSYPIVGKYDYDGRCYLDIEIEVSPEEYIGYDVGDEYESED